jgi:transposase InsO family protein
VVADVGPRIGGIVPFRDYPASRRWGGRWSTWRRWARCSAAAGWSLHVLLRREGWEVNHKRVYRLYAEEGLAVRRKAPRRHASSQVRAARPVAEAANRVWAMDFVSDALSDGRRFRVLTVVDTFTREALAARADARITGD